MSIKDIETPIGTVGNYSVMTGHEKEKEKKKRSC